MQPLISKLQYKNYEKGEFTDEQPRDLQQTLDLIRNYPWDRQRGEDIQLTCPSVTIRNSVGEYLKLGVYFSGKFALYLLDGNNDLYERHETTIDNAIPVIEQFFNDAIDTGTFEKHHFAIGPRSHFETKNFVYSVNETSVMWRIFFMGLFALYFFLMPWVILLIKGPLLVELFFLAFTVFMGIMLSRMGYYLYKICLKSRDWYLNISTGMPTFEFGETVESIRIYNKSDIEQLVIFGNPSGKGSNISMLAKIIFRDGSTLEIPGILIDSLTFIAKFPGVKREFKTKQRELIAETRAFIS